MKLTGDGERTIPSADKLCWPTTTTVCVYTVQYRHDIFSSMISLAHVVWSYIFRIIFPYAYILSTWRDLWKGKRNNKQTNDLPLSLVWTHLAHAIVLSGSHIVSERIKNCPQNIQYFVSLVVGCRLSVVGRRWYHKTQWMRVRWGKCAYRNKYRTYVNNTSVCITMTMLKKRKTGKK